MFKYFIEMRELKMAKLQFETALMGKLFGLVEGFPDLLELAKRAKDLDSNELQKLIASELVGYIKKNEEAQSAVNEANVAAEKANNASTEA